MRSLYFAAFGLLSSLSVADHAARPPRPRAEVRPADVAGVQAILDAVAQEIPGYSAFDNCLSFAQVFHQRCAERGLNCRIVGTQCEGGSGNHSFNMIEVAQGNWRLVEPQVRQADAALHPTEFRDPDAIPPAALCGFLGKAMNGDNCPCSAFISSSTPIAGNRSPLLECAMSEAFRSMARSDSNARYCQACCRERARYYTRTERETGDDLRSQEWVRECNNHCITHLRPLEPGAGGVTTPRNNDTAAVATGRSCTKRTSFWDAGTYLEQCRACCVEGAIADEYPRTHLPTCHAACASQYR